MSARRPGPHGCPRILPTVRSLATLWSIGLLAAVLGLASFTGLHAAEFAPSGRATATPTATGTEEPTANAPATRSWLTAALTTTSVTGAGADRRSDPDTTLPAAFDDRIGHLFRATAVRTEPAAGPLLPERVTAHLPDSRAPPNQQV